MKAIALIKIFILVSVMLYAQQDNTVKRIGKPEAAVSVAFNQENFPGRKKGLKAALKAIEIGDEYYYNEKMGDVKYRLALPYFKDANLFNPNNALLNYQIGHCYMYTYEKVNAINYMRKAKKLDPDVDINCDYNLGRAFQIEYAFELAIEHFESYKKALDREELAKEQEDIDKHIQECRTAMELLDEAPTAEIENLGKTINSYHPEYSPLVNENMDMMVFTSRRESTYGGGISELDQEYYEDIYVTYKKDNAWTEPQNIGRPVNSAQHDATVFMSQDGKSLYIYRDLGKKRGSGDVFECHLQVDGTWSEPQKLPEPISSEYQESSICYAGDKSEIFFVSDRPGGIGGRDIYVANLNKATNTYEVENIGDVLNTQYDEEGLYIHPDGHTLYFSSKGHNTMGGFDIFKSERVDGEWQKPENMRYPINTPDNDVYFVIDRSNRYAFISSERYVGSGEKDIYLVTFLEETKDPTITATGFDDPFKLKIVEKIMSVDPVTEENLVEGEMIDNDDPINANEIAGNTYVDTTKEELILTVSNEATLVDTVVFATDKLLASEKIVQQKDTVVQIQKPKTKEQLIEERIEQDIKRFIEHNIQMGVIENVFFDFDRSSIRPESYMVLDLLAKVLNRYTDLNFEIAGHTDSVGHQDYNIVLSVLRAQSVVKYLIGKGVAKERLAYKGYGGAQPIASNKTREGRGKNRRTEIRIINAL